MNSLVNFQLVPIYKTSEFTQNLMKSLDVQGHLLLYYFPFTALDLLFFPSLSILQLLINSPFVIAIVKDGLIPYNMYIYKVLHQMSHALIKYVCRYKL